MARSSMAWLITTIREMTQSREGTPFAALVSDDQIQRQLDRTGLRVNLLLLTPVESIGPGGVVSYFQFDVAWGDWEDDVKLQSPNGWVTITPSRQFLDIGRWLFSETQNNGVFLTGTTYDRYLAAAYVLEEHLASQELYTFNFAAGGESFNREAIRQHYLDQAQRYRTQARPLMGELVRGDAALG